MPASGDVDDVARPQAAQHFDGFRPPVGAAAAGGIGLPRGGQLLDFCFCRSRLRALRPAARVEDAEDLVGPRQRGDQLLCASQDGHLESIYIEILHQLRATPHLAAQIDWDRSRVKPYRVLVARNGNRLEMRPAGYDGEALRGLHVGLAAYFDEAAKVKNPRCFDEFFRAVKPGAETRIYSTPDGDRSVRPPPRPPPPPRRAEPGRHRPSCPGRTGRQSAGRG